jgi:hypothetical protein
LEAFCEIESSVFERSGEGFAAAFSTRVPESAAPSVDDEQPRANTNSAQSDDLDIKASCHNSR